MAPKRFKAVCTETGREFLPFGLYAQRFLNHDGIDFIEGHHSIVSIGACKIDVPSVELCQSTGLTDSRGVEVFEGDVLACECHMDISVVWVDKSPTKGPIAAWGWKYFHPDFDHVQYHNTFQNSGLCLKRTVIGNRWQPAAELQARAEAVSNGK